MCHTHNCSPLKQKTKGTFDHTREFFFFWIDSKAHLKSKHAPSVLGGIDQKCWDDKILGIKGSFPMEPNLLMGISKQFIGDQRSGSLYITFTN